MEIHSGGKKTNMAAGQAYADRELYSICQALVNKFEEIKAGKKAFITNELKSAVRVLLFGAKPEACLLYTSPSPRDQRGSRMPSSA